ncbi:proline--tRNA ligase [Candidatus Woesearchaeota archaeon]|nr:proline--tRNA ligase [Candidatus Woesearchaeota archaeon]
MPKEKNIGITTKKQDDMPEWYSQVCQKAELADTSTIKGFMVIRPNAYSIWENIQAYFNKVIKEKGVRNAYFPLLIPESFFKKEAEHAEGFAPELAWIEKTEEDEERLAIRPTSETIMYDSYSKWVRSHRDLPLRINQWCNVLRWEVKQTKVFLRTREFLWQEGHCVYETEKQSNDEALMFLDEYKKLVEDLLAIPVLIGQKTAKEKFAGAKTTYTIEAFMPDGKALQCGTSHNLGQGFSKGFGIKYLGKDEKMHTPWQNSWGFSTRLIGAIIMAHGDNKGLILPPRIAENKLVIVPIIKGKDTKQILDKAEELKQQLKEFNPLLDDRDEYTPGWKYNEWEMKGIPLRAELGPKDLAKDQVVLVRRDTGEKTFVKIKELNKKIPKILDDIHKNLFTKSQKFLKTSTITAKKWGDVVKGIREKKIVKMPFCGEGECEDWIKDKTEGASSRLISFDEKAKAADKCLHCGKKAKYITYFSKSY